MSRLRLLAVALLLVFFGLTVAPAYHWARQRQFTWLAHHAYTRGEDLKASFYAQALLFQNPRDETGLEILSAVTRKGGAPQALSLTQRWMRLNPRDPERQLALAEIALRFHQLDIAAQSIATADTLALGDVQKNNLQALRISLALTRGNMAAVEELLRADAAQHPQQPLPRFNLANFLLSLPDPAHRTEGMDLLRELWKAKLLPVPTARSLANASLRDQQPAQTLEWTSFLVNQPNTTIDDLLLHAEANRLSGQPMPGQLFATMATLCHQHQEGIYQILEWHRQRTLFQAGLDWLHTLPVEDQNLPLARIGTAEILTDLHDWPELERTLPAQNWGSADHFRWAFLLRCQHENATGQDPHMTKLIQNQMIGSLLNNLGDLPRLRPLFRSWSWPEEDRQILEAVASKTSIPEVLLLRWLDTAQQEKDTVALYYFGLNLLERHPENPIAANNVSMYGLLLGIDPDRWTAQAEKLHHETAGNLIGDTTYAFSLYLQKRYPESVALFEEHSPEERQRPDVALYYGLALRAVGRTADAAPFLQEASRGDLLPEERHLLTPAHE